MDGAMNVNERDRSRHLSKTAANSRAQRGVALGSAFTAFGLRAEAEPIRKGLHVVATPIGNLGDISFRALPRSPPPTL